MWARYWLMFLVLLCFCFLISIYEPLYVVHVEIIILVWWDLRYANL
jgi:hypothetical protein